MHNPFLPSACNRLIDLAQSRLADTKAPVPNSTEITEAIDRLNSAGTATNVQCFAKFNLEYILARSNEISHATTNLIERLIDMPLHPTN